MANRRAREVSPGHIYTHDELNELAALGTRSGALAGMRELKEGELILLSAAEGLRLVGENGKILEFKKIASRAPFRTIALHPRESAIELYAQGLERVSYSASELADIKLPRPRLEVVLRAIGVRSYVYVHQDTLDEIKSIVPPQEPLQFFVRRSVGAAAGNPYGEWRGPFDLPSDGVVFSTSSRPFGYRVQAYLITPFAPRGLASTAVMRAD